MASHKGRHRRPSKTVKAAKISGAGIVTASAITAFAGVPANAQVLPRPTGAAVQDFVRQYVPKHEAVTTAVTEVTVHSGDDLSDLAGKYCGNPKDWTGWWNYNHKTLGWKDPDLIYVGQHVVPDCRDEQVWLPQPKVIVTSSYQGTTPAPQVQTTYSGGSSYGNVNPASYGGGFEQCVISRESGGNSQVMNSSGHYGLFQFDYGTWVSGGGNGADFGHATPSEQQRVFENVYAARGAEPWAPSDGC